MWAQDASIWVRNSLCGYFLSYLYALLGYTGWGLGWGLEISSNLFQLGHPSLLMPNFLLNREHLIFFVICLARWLWRCLKNPVYKVLLGLAELYMFCLFLHAQQSCRYSSVMQENLWGPIYKHSKQHLLFLEYCCFPGSLSKMQDYLPWFWHFYRIAFCLNGAKSIGTKPYGENC